MQGWKTFIPTDQKIKYLNELLKVGFDTIDFGSFVSAKAIPQMSDTKDVLKELDVAGSKSKLLAIVANTRGAEEAIAFAKIDYLGFPLSVSETFQQRNTNASIVEGLNRVKEIQHLCEQSSKKLVVYLSMAFGNPYGDIYSESMVLQYANQVLDYGVKIISIADTVGVATAEQVSSLMKIFRQREFKAEIGVHLHSTNKNWKEKLSAAFKNGVMRFDGSINGIGGCPMADDELVGNMDTLLMIDYFKKENHLPAFDMKALARAVQLANKIFN